MTSVEPPAPTPAGRVVRLLWSAARRRADGRARRQRELMGRKSKGGSDDLAWLARMVAVLVVCSVHGGLGWCVLQFARGAVLVEAGHQGLIAIPIQHRELLQDLAAQQEKLLRIKRDLAAMAHPLYTDRQNVNNVERDRDSLLTRLATRTQPPGRGRAATAASEYRSAVERQLDQHGTAGFVLVDNSLAGQLAKSRDAPQEIMPVVGLMLMVWVAMLVCQGEGLELDMQRRRHPMWEWLLSHPVRPAHAFYAELLAPMMSNPVYLAAPVFLWVIFGHLFGTGSGLLAALLVGIPLAAATSGLNKAIETTALLRLGMRSRGALLGVLSWFGYVAMFLPFILLRFDGAGHLLGRLGDWLVFAFPAWPVRALTVGWGQASSLPEAVISWWVLAVALGAVALWVTHRATGQGLQAPSLGIGPAKVRWLGPNSRLGSDPLQRKELLWLLRDRGAIVQVVLIPLTIAAAQAFNFRGLYHLTSTNWSAVCGLAVICGTYFLLVLGPRSLASEGGALWLSLTWPHGLEELLKAKARLWNRMANLLVGTLLVVAAVIYPEAWWKIALVGCGWLLFGGMLALKAVSLVTAPSSSGEAEPPNRAQRWIALIGTLAFGTGIITQTWHVAILGLVFSSLVSVAMWQGLRARLPHLFDPWSAQPVPAPSLLQVTVGIALMVEFIGVASGIAFAVGGPDSLWLARALGYGLMGTVACVFMQQFLAERGVKLAEVIRWSGPAPLIGLPAGLALGAGMGLGLAWLAAGYMALLQFVPAARESLEEAAKFAAVHEGENFWIFLLAVGFAPFAEEYFFRGLLFRTLDRELDDWRALVLSAGFFAVFHPPLAWIPVACLGLGAAWLFKRTRHLLPCVVCHMTYNAGVLLLAHLGR